MPAPTTAPLAPSRHHPRAPVLVGAAVLVATLSACSDDGGGSDDGAATRGPATTGAPTSLVPIGAGGLSTTSTLTAAATVVPPTAVSPATAGSDTSSTPGATAIPAGATQVMIADLAFQPDVVKVAPGQPLVFTNADTRAHSVASATSELLQSDTLEPGTQFTVTFDTPGTYDYFCGIHSHMSGTIEVSS